MLKIRLPRIAADWLLSVALSIAALLPMSVTTSHATVVEYNVTSLGADAWRYDYTIKSIDTTKPFDDLTVFFDVAKYDLLSDPIAPSGWDPIVVQGDPSIPADGYYDAFRLSGLVTDLADISGFSVSFIYLVAGTPGAQTFSLLDSSDFSYIQFGTTRLGGAVAVPEPSIAALLLAGVSALFFMRSSRRRGGLRGTAVMAG